MSCSNPRFLPHLKDYFGNRIPVPCRVCLGCKIDKQRFWYWRLQDEFVHSKSSSFVCLTYDDYHLPFKTGYFCPTLDKLELHHYFDRLRNYIKRRDTTNSLVDPHFKYFAVGEYGDSGNRPHYHVLFFGLDYMQAYKIIKDNWKNGSVDCKPIKSGALRYVLKYIDKQLSGEYRDKQYYDVGLEPPFQFSSHYLGYHFIYSQLEYVRKYGQFKIGARFVPVPQYFKNQFVDFTKDYYNFFKSNHDNLVNELKQESNKYGFGDDYLAWLRNQAKIKEASLLARERLNLKPVLDVLTPNQVDNIYPLSHNELNILVEDSLNDR